MGAIVSAVALRRGSKGETTTLRSESSNQNIMMNPSGTKFSGEKIVPKSDLRAGTASDRIIKKEVNTIATWNARLLQVCGKLESIKVETKRLNINILGRGETKRKDEGDFWSDNYRVIYSGYKKNNTGVGIILTKEWGQRVKELPASQLQNYAY